MVFHPHHVVERGGGVGRGPPSAFKVARRRCEVLERRLTLTHVLRSALLLLRRDMLVFVLEGRRDRASSRPPGMFREARGLVCEPVHGARLRTELEGVRRPGLTAQRNGLGSFGREDDLAGGGGIHPLQEQEDDLRVLGKSWDEIFRWMVMLMVAMRTVYKKLPTENRKNYMIHQVMDNIGVTPILSMTWWIM